ncbi:MULTISPECIES: ATP-binding protein [Ornithinibacillus]|uniref:ATP-binding protein n=1 Tax=Ornithinibacillus TaxID=484508 RepID=UPI00064DE677|nr:ATP-binding protein [Ornithinibacillus contaminans]
MSNAYKNSSKPEISTRPSIPSGGHPIEQGDYLIDTISINELADSVLKWINLRNPGAVIYGEPRLGKSYAIKYIQKVFDLKYKSQWFTYIVRTRKMRNPNENRFFEHLLKDIGHELYNIGKVDAKRDRLINFLFERGNRSIRNQIVLFIDDAQRLGTVEYEWLMDVYNELESYGITLTTILVGQKELSNRRNTYLTSDKQIVGRFMIHENRFYGLREPEELAFLLSSYDDVTEYPTNSGWSYTRYFFPVAYSEGLRLENETEVIWQCIQEIRAKAGVKHKIEIPMHYMIAIINYVLKKFGANEGNERWPTTNMWLEAIIESGYVNAAEVISYDD